MKKKSWLWDWFAVFLWATVIFVFSSVPEGFVPAPFAGADKIFHFLEYLPLGFFLRRSLCRSFHLNVFHSFWTTFFMTLLYALSDEVHQLSVPGRQFSLADILFDGMGAATGSFLYRQWHT